jgi:hypothetical protein
MVSRVGKRPGTTRPSHVFELTPEVEQLLSNAYIPLLMTALGAALKSEPENATSRHNASRTRSSPASNRDEEASFSAERPHPAKLGDPALDLPVIDCACQQIP